MPVRVNRGNIEPIFFYLIYLEVGARFTSPPGYWFRWFSGLVNRAPTSRGPLRKLQTYGDCTNITSLVGADDSTSCEISMVAFCCSMCLSVPVDRLECLLRHLYASTG